MQVPIPNLVVIAIALFLFAITLVIVPWLYTRRQQRRTHALLSTGLRVIDLFTPIPLGGSVLVSGAEKSGAKLLGTELAYRLLHHPANPCHVVYYIDAALTDRDNIVQELQETVPGLTKRFIVQSVSIADIQQHCCHGPRNHPVAVFAISMEARFLHTFIQSVDSARLESQDSRFFTTFAITEGIMPSGFDVQIISSQLLAKAAIYPAVDLRVSSSTVMLIASPGSHERNVLAAAKKSIEHATQELYPEALQDSSWVLNRDPAQRVAVQLLRFCSQPYFVAEQYTGQSAVFVPRHDAVEAFERIASGSLKNIESKKFQLQNALPGR